MRAQRLLVLLVAAVPLTACADAGTSRATATVTVTASPQAPTPLPDAVPAPAAPSPTAATGPERPAPSADAPALSADSDHLSVDALHAQGADHQIAEFQLQMDSYTGDATAAVMAFAPYNPPPSEGAHAVATWTVTYTGAGEGMPYAELATAVMGGDGVQYPHGTCAAVIEDGLFTKVRVLNPGGTTSFATCYDAPLEALTGATAVRAGTIQRTERVDWSTRP